MWYRLKNDGHIEYSTDFNFFRENQIRIVKTGTKYQYCSRLESKTFHTETAYNRVGELDNADIEHRIKIIHTEILSGKHGEGDLVD
jgi:hypothetical protein